MIEIKAVLFDLDDTLYPEARYRDSAFHHVANLLSDPLAVRKLLDGFSNDSPYPLTEIVKWLVAEYRCHVPSITPYPDVWVTLSELKAEGCRIGLITNNATGAQPLKLEALGLSAHFDAVVIAEPPDLKPSLVPFQKCLDLLGVLPSQSLMVGDDPYTDLKPAVSLGMRAIRIERAGQLKGPFPFEDGIPIVSGLDEIIHLLGKL